MNRLKNTLIELGWLEEENCGKGEKGATPLAKAHQKGRVGAL